MNKIPDLGGDEAGSGLPHPQEQSHQADQAVAEALFTARFEALVRDMGEMLRRTAVSTNIKERLDFSCGLLDAAGRLVVNAPHIPVHLGALGLCVRRVAEVLPPWPGDVMVTNHPAFGGSHLPDVTVLTPVFEADQLLGWVASRAHHAEIGGSRPGSMPPAARCLAEEGVVIPPTRLFEQGVARWADLAQALGAGPFPSRNVGENLADLEAAVAANRRGELLLLQLASEHGRELVEDHMTRLAQRSARGLARALTARGAWHRRVEHRLDDGSPLVVTIDFSKDRRRIDFTGTGPVLPGNLNAPPAVLRSAVLYVLRLLLDEDLPLNEGLLEDVELFVPEGTFLSPSFVEDPWQCPAVVGGNTETSQRVVNLLLEAFELAAASQGTMNNTLFGNDRFGYYETVAGGCGATAVSDGASATHSHMTNTRITDPEILELRYPVRLIRFERRAGSGGAGRFSGGDGVVREYLFLDHLEVSVLTQQRNQGPRGAAGGEAGAPGRQTIVRRDGRRHVLAAIDGCSVEPGDGLLLETPGGGGWGPPQAANAQRDVPTQPPTETLAAPQNSSLLRPATKLETPHPDQDLKEPR